ncbi:D-alanyl-D-alanine carboxypeptidase family protein [Gordonia phthalatica]|uniref:Peptidase S11 n=1 Tax=Gordonia phthalatica TaxID=1136941 RepID=A0A0N7FVB1_9ACTN|nr:D-alanyl-D-alanine carboxypeptidase family protein [Gordonia phthalatica]ALG86663.1 peptidase S11 [Gordonia phthalatica]
MTKSFLTRIAAVAAAFSLVATLAAPTAHAFPGDPGVAPTHAPLPTPNTDSCPYRSLPAPAVDESEVVQPGETTPTPLPVPATPVGGEQLAGCGVISDPAAGPLPDRLNAAGWLIADLESGRIIAAKDPHGRYRPASTIKVLLAIVALDELELDDPVEATPNDWSMEGDSCGMGPGGEYTVRDMLTGLLVVSGNDCANALARLLGGYDATLDKMNQKAADLGALDTRAASPSGLDAPGMSASPYDLAVLFRAAMRNETFRQMISMKTYQFPGYPKRKDVPGDVDHPSWTMGTSNTLLRDGWPGMLGGKTGYTDDALKTFVGAAERDGRAVVIVQVYGLNEMDNLFSTQAAKMFEYGFAAPESVSIGTLGSDHVDPATGETHSADGHNDDVSPRSAWTFGLLGVAAVCAALAALLWRKRRRGR